MKLGQEMLISSCRVTSSALVCTVLLQGELDSPSKGSVGFGGSHL